MKDLWENIKKICYFQDVTNRTCQSFCAFVKQCTLMDTFRLFTWDDPFATCRHTSLKLASKRFPNFWR